MSDCFFKPKRFPVVKSYIHLNQKNMPRGTKVENKSVSDQPHEIKYEAKKTGVKPSEIKDAKKGGSNQRKEIEKKVK